MGERSLRPNRPERTRLVSENKLNLFSHASFAAPRTGARVAESWLLAPVQSSPPVSAAALVHCEGAVRSAVCLWCLSGSSARSLLRCLCGSLLARWEQ